MARSVTAAAAAASEGVKSAAQSVRPIEPNLAAVSTSLGFWVVQQELLSNATSMTQ